MLNAINYEAAGSVSLLFQLKLYSKANGLNSKCLTLPTIAHPIGNIQNQEEKSKNLLIQISLSSRIRLFANISTEHDSQQCPKPHSYLVMVLCMAFTPAVSNSDGFKGAR